MSSNLSDCMCDKYCRKCGTDFESVQDPDTPLNGWCIECDTCLYCCECEGVLNNG